MIPCPDYMYTPRVVALYPQHHSEFRIRYSDELIPLHMLLVTLVIFLKIIPCAYNNKNGKMDSDTFM